MKSGETFAHYEIIGPIGSGGMGEVFSARDTRLEREVALKVLPPDFAADPERMSRFRREAKLLAALNHTNIAAIHGLEEDQGKLFLAMELAPGETLEARILRGPMPVEEALTVAVQMAAGLEEAHEKSIVHRDLKPANVKLGEDGRIKILDFGLARAYLGEEKEVSDSGTSPTLTAAMTQAGVILGSAAYMSPEQARGHQVDARTDIWAFGVILWELLAGQRLFAGDTVSDTLAMVLRSEPDWSVLPTDLPPSLRRLLQRCLQRDKRQRLHHIADARIVMEEILRDGTSAYAPVMGDIAPDPGASRRSTAGWIVAAVLAVVAAGLGWQAFQRPAPEYPSPMRFELTMPEGQWIESERQSLAVTPDGDALAISLGAGNKPQLYYRTMADPTLMPIAGTENSASPFFSRDGRWLCFTRASKMMKVDLEGGSPIELCDAPWGGGSWTSDDRIVFTQSYASGLFILPAAGGSSRELTRPDPAHNELGHWWPQVLPGDEWVVYTGYSTPIEQARIMALNLTSGEQRLLIEGGAFGRWAPTGHLLYVKDSRLMAAPFDREKMTVTGTAEPVLEDVYFNIGDGYAPLAFGANGTLVYAQASVMNAPNRLAWVDRQGEISFLDLPEGHYRSPALAPDGRRLAVPILDKQNTDIWIHDLERGTSSRFTFLPSTDFYPRWTPDSRTVIYNAEEPQYTIYRRPADGSKNTEPLVREPVDTRPNCVSPDGQWLVYSESALETSNDIWLLPLDPLGEPRLFLQTPFSESEAAISPDGRWLAYQSDESGQSEIYAMPFPDGGARTQVSIGGGSQPLWSPRGDEIFFQNPGSYLAVKVDQELTTDTDLVVSRPQPLFQGADPNARYSWEALSPDRDARRFLVAHTPDESKPRTLQVVVNWFSELRP